MKKKKNIQKTNTAMEMFAFCLKTFEPVEVKIVSTSKNKICRIIAFFSHLVVVVSILLIIPNAPVLHNYLHSVAKVYAVLPFYDVKCLCSGGRE